MSREEKIRLRRGKSSAYIISNLNREAVIPATEELLELLEKYQIRAFMDRSAKKWIKNERVSFSDDAKEMANVDLLFVVGGDGTILRAAKRAVVYDKPILGINAGRLGFLSDIETEDLPVIEKLIKTGCPIENRMALKVSVGDQSFYAVNDVYVTKTEPGKISELFVECDNREVCRYRADGIVLATPEGSTAYSMSAGGPVLDTKLNAIIMTPVCPHSLISCSIVFSPDKTITIGSSFNGDDDRIHVVVDGDIISNLQKGEKVTVCPSDRAIRFVNISGRGFYEVLNQKFIGRR